MTLIVDANGGYSDAVHAKPVAALLAQMGGYEWFEEPVPFWEYDTTRQVKQFGLIPIAAGENEYRMDVFERMLLRGTVDIVQPDFGYVGGFTNALKVAQIANGVGVRVDPHSPDKSMTEYFSLHLLGAIPNPGPALEFGCVDPTDISKTVFVDPILVSQGKAQVPQGLGWGVQLLKSWLKRATSQSYPPSL